MSDAERTHASYDRLRKGRDLVRRTALLLSSREAFDELFDRLASLLAEFVDASIVLVATGTGSQARLAYVYADGIGGPPDDATLRPGSTTERVLRSGKVKLYRSRVDWPNQRRLSLDGRMLHLPEAAIFVPILFGGSPVGVLSVQSRRADAYDGEDAALLETCAFYLGARIHDAQQREQSAHLELLATTDALTGLLNRRAFDEAVAREWRRCARNGDSLGIALLDVDYFKAFNDAYGHVAGDTCLRQIAQAVVRCLKRPGDLAARYGGEEFGLVLPGTDATGTVRLCEAICEALRAIEIPHQGSSLGFVTVSIGGVTLIPRGDDDPQSAVAAADALLYRAKITGRNRVVAEGYESDSPAAQIRAVAHHNVPGSHNRFVGRAREVATIVESMRRSRLVSIVGPGGVGKTRVALEATRGIVDTFPEGVWVVDLAPIADPALVAATAAVAVGINLAPSSDPAASLAEQLKPARLLMFFDNCEHVLDAAAHVVDTLLGTCPSVRVLATSRESLGVTGESVLRLGPMDDASSIALFCARAADANPSFEPSAANAELVAAICGHLDGIALAIELAAAWMRALAPELILKKLAEAPSSPTLHTLVDWSYALLSERERAVFRRLSVFAGSFSLDAADAVALDGAGRREADGALRALVEKSLMVKNGVERYRLLDSMLGFARAQLEASGETERVRLAHARHFADESARMSAAYGEISEETWLERYEPWLDNFRAALEWSASREPALAAAISGNLGMFWHLAGLDVEGMQRSEAALAALGENARLPEHTRAWLAVGWSAERLFKSRQTLEAGEAALALAREAGDPLLIGEAMVIVGNAHHRLGNDPQLAHAMLQEAAEIFRERKKPFRAAHALISQATSLVRAGNLSEARSSLEEAAKLARASNWPRLVRSAEGNLAEVEFALGRIDEASELGARCVEMFRLGRSNLQLASALANLASYLAVAGRTDEAADSARKAIALAVPYESEVHMAIGVQALALCDVHRGNVRRAARLLGFVDATYDRRGAMREPTEATVRERIVETLGTRPDYEEMKREVDRGRDLDLQGAYRLAMR